MHAFPRTRWTPHTLTLFVATLCLAAMGRADTATFKQGATTPVVGGSYAGADDTMLVINGAGSTDQNFGARTNVEVGEIPLQSNALRHALMRFDVTALAGQYTSIDAVTLRLYPLSVDTLADDSVNAFRVTPANAAWVEGTGIGILGSDPPDTGESTWAQRIQGSQNWAGSAGASTAGTDYAAAGLGFTAFSGATGTGAANPFDIVLSPAQLTTMFNDWTSGNNSGLFLRVGAETDRSITFNSAESVDPAVRPELIVTYTAIPEPTALAVAAAALALLRRRQRESN